MKPRSAVARMLALFRRPKLDREMDDEILLTWSWPSAMRWPQAWYRRKRVKRPDAISEESNR